MRMIITFFIIEDIYRVLRNSIHNVDNIISSVQDIYRVLINSIHDVFIF
jgi:hypothetical protein